VEERAALGRPTDEHGRARDTCFANVRDGARPRRGPRRSCGRQSSARGVRRRRPPARRTRAPRCQGDLGPAEFTEWHNRRAGEPAPCASARAPRRRARRRGLRRHTARDPADGRHEERRPADEGSRHGAVRRRSALSRRRARPRRASGSPAGADRRDRGSPRRRRYARTGRGSRTAGRIPTGGGGPGARRGRRRRARRAVPSPLAARRSKPLVTADDARLRRALGRPRTGHRGAGRELVPDDRRPQAARHRDVASRLPDRLAAGRRGAPAHRARLRVRHRRVGDGRAQGAACENACDRRAPRDVTVGRRVLARRNRDRVLQGQARRAGAGGVRPSVPPRAAPAAVLLPAAPDF
jgi:hypothetical protein